MDRLLTCADSKNDTTTPQKLDIGGAWCLSVLMELVFGHSKSSLCGSETLHHKDDLSEHWVAVTSFPFLQPLWPIGMLDMPLLNQTARQLEEWQLSPLKLAKPDLAYQVLVLTCV